MTRTHWQSLLERLGVPTDETSPAPAAGMDDFERVRGVRLPASYRSYCEVFGAGVFDRDQLVISVPGRPKERSVFSLDYVEDAAHNHIGAKTWSRDLVQHNRAVLFGSDEVRSYFFFDPLDVTDKANNEYAICVLNSDFSVQRVAANFWEFVNQVCGGDDKDDPEGESSFTPM